jgi:hypothetical protein
MKQVTREEFEVLKNYVPCEVRYYVTANQIPTKTNGSGIKLGKYHPAGTQNARVQMTNSQYSYKAGSISEKVQFAIWDILGKDPTRIIGRKDLVTQIVRKTGMKKVRVSPPVTDMLANGSLRYVGK